jgi:hypothetical protein
VKYPEAPEGQEKSGDIRRLDLPEFGDMAAIFLQIQIGDSLESQAVILCL